jgi:hypothetical protein
VVFAWHADSYQASAAVEKKKSRMDIDPAPHPLESDLVDSASANQGPMAPPSEPSVTQYIAKKLSLVDMTGQKAPVPLQAPPRRPGPARHDSPLTTGQDSLTIDMYPLSPDRDLDVEMIIDEKDREPLFMAGGESVPEDEPVPPPNPAASTSVIPPEPPRLPPKLKKNKSKSKPAKSKATESGKKPKK